MATTESDEEAEQRAGTVWEGYSDYRAVGDRIARTIDDAVEAYAVIDARHTEGAPVTPELASEARSRITSAAMKVKYEMEQDRGTKPIYNEILGRWEGEEGYIAMFDRVQLTRTRPAWLPEFVEDLRKAGWELGYLQAGRTTSTEEGDEVTRQVNSMFKQ